MDLTKFEKNIAGIVVYNWGFDSPCRVLRKIIGGRRAKGTPSTITELDEGKSEYRRWEKNLKKEDKYKNNECLLVQQWKDGMFFSMSQVEWNIPSFTDENIHTIAWMNNIHYLFYLISKQAWNYNFF